MIIRRDDTFRVICEFQTHINPTNTIVGTGIFVHNENCRGWIITASHVAKKTNADTQIVIANDDGKAIVLPLTTFGSPSGWTHHPIADISAFQICFNEKNIALLQSRCFPFDHFNLERKCVSRDFELTSIGFPNGLGTDGFFSPFSFRSYAASGFVTLPRADTHTLSTFFCLENPSVGGYSGCPVFDLGYETNGMITATKEKTWCHGIMHGTMSDTTGGKIAMVTPAFYLKDLIS